MTALPFVTLMRVKWNLLVDLSHLEGAEGCGGGVGKESEEGGEPRPPRAY